MVNEKQCYKKFCKITDGKENEGYGEWKEWVLKQIESYDKKQLTNLEKRTEIKLKNKEADCNIKQQTISSYGIPVVCAMFSIIVTIIVSPMKNAEYNDMSRMIEFLYMNGGGGVLVSADGDGELHAVLLAEAIQPVQERLHRLQVGAAGDLAQIVHEHIDRKSVV